MATQDTTAPALGVDCFVGDLDIAAGTATDPSCVRELREIVAQCGSSVRWIVSDGTISKATLDLAIGAATQVVLPILEASQSGSVILAMTHGRCVATTTVGEIPSTLGDRGVVVAPGEREELIQALVLAARDPDLCDELGDRAREYALKERAWPVIAARTLRLYEWTERP